MHFWGRNGHWTCERICKAFREFHQRHKRWPMTADLKHYGTLPDPATVFRVYGTLKKARLEAGAAHGGLEGRGGAGRGGGYPRGEKRRGPGGKRLHVS